MNRLPIARAAAVLGASVLIGGAVVSVALAATINRTPSPPLPNDSLSQAEADRTYDVVVEAAAAAVGISAQDIAHRLEAGESLAQIATAEGVAYANVARAVNDAVSTTRHTQTEAIVATIAAWIDAGGQPDADWLDSKDGH